MQSSILSSEIAKSQANRFLGEQPVSVHEQTGGLSGAKVWRIESSRGTFALRQYPVEFPTQERLQGLHGFLKEVQVRGCTLLPCPVATREGPTWIKHDARHWEMLTWVHGEPLLESAPCRELLITSVKALARLHTVTAQFPISQLVKHGEILVGVGQGLLYRENLALRWQKHDATKVDQLLEQKSFSPTLRRIFQLQQAAVSQHFDKLQKLFQQTVQSCDRLIPVLRDVQPAHVIFNDKEVAGFIDVTAARVDSAMGDLARLLHRWRYAEPEWYADALAAYHTIRPLENDERVVLDAYDFSSRLLTGVQWLRWVVLEEREFANQVLVEQHWERIERDLGRMLGSSSSVTAKPSVLLP